ncbi:polysaccharide biosynthesis/export family protein [Pelagibius marinus]|uniref:polysaccharide biosynthesis/export family protein n=1 Tax=Pelagibius marinus TaxID=2762760 RepID=UPI001872D74F|nr:polysaccharide biosynthesis/export family protein [Pelagibius marinus]
MTIAANASRLGALFGLVLLLAGCTGVSSLPPLPAAEEGPYRLGAGDRVRLQVFGQEELSQEYLISDSGTITMPLVGSVEAEGRSLPALEGDIAARLSDGILVSPNVTAEIVNYRPFYILGETKAPGQYPYVPRMTVLTAVSMSGGYTFRADQDQVSITRMVDGRMSEFRADPLAYVEPGDVINVYERYF